MSNYLKWDKKAITDFSEQNINALYNQGYLFTRQGRGEMYQTRSLRIDLSKFELSSENRRVLRKNESVALAVEPLSYQKYNWTIGKLGKDFYNTKFGEKTFSANKIKQLLTEPEKSNFNLLLVYSMAGVSEPIGYAICYQNNQLLHYCYPFYRLGASIPNFGLGMMLGAIIRAKENEKIYIYLGSFQRPADIYKLQFAGLEWWNGESWATDQKQLKETLEHEA